jgi:hypothetical protein
VVWNERKKPPGFAAFRDEIFIAEKEGGYKGPANAEGGIRSGE